MHVSQHNSEPGFKPYRECFGYCDQPTASLTEIVDVSDLENAPLVRHSQGDQSLTNQSAYRLRGIFKAFCNV